MNPHYIVVADTGELAPGQMKPVTAGGRRLLLVFTGGEYFVVDELCSHEDYSLAYGCIKDGKIKCSLHGIHFDLATGKPREEPATEPIGTYPVKIVDNKVCVAVDESKNGQAPETR